MPPRRWLLRSPVPRRDGWPDGPRFSCSRLRMWPVPEWDGRFLFVVQGWLFGENCWPAFHRSSVPKRKIWNSICCSQPQTPESSLFPKRWWTIPNRSDWPAPLVNGRVGFGGRSPFCTTTGATFSLFWFTDLGTPGVGSEISFSSPFSFFDLKFCLFACGCFSCPLRLAWLGSDCSSILPITGQACWWSIARDSMPSTCSHFRSMCGCGGGVWWSPSSTVAGKVGCGRGVKA